MLESGEALRAGYKDVKLIVYLKTLCAADSSDAAA
jgi:hypothetical protein